MDHPPISDVWQITFVTSKSFFSLRTSQEKGKGWEDEAEGDRQPEMRSHEDRLAESVSRGEQKNREEGKKKKDRQPKRITRDERHERQKRQKGT